MRAVLLGDLTAVQQRLDAHAHQRRGHQPEQREHRVAPADVGRVEEGVAQTVVVREPLERAAGVGDDHELLGLGQRAEVAVLRERLDVPPDFEETMNSVRSRSTDVLRQRAIASGWVESSTLSLKPAGRSPNDLRITSGPSEDPPMPEQHRVGEALCSRHASANACSSGAARASSRTPSASRAGPDLGHAGSTPQRGVPAPHPLRRPSRRARA